MTNDELSKLFPDWTAEKIEAKTGIWKRHVCAHDEIASDCATKAAELLFDEHQFDRSKVDFLIFVTQTNDYTSPTSACIIQDRLGLPTTCGAFDVNLGCSGWVYGLSIAKGMILSGAAQNVLLLTSETLSKYLHPGDKSARTIFGDAGAATLLAADENQNGIGSFVFGTDGSGKEIMFFENGGYRNSNLKVCGLDYVDEYGNTTNPDYFHMRGPEVFIFSIKKVPGLIKETLEKAGLGIDDINIFIFHQANAFMLETLRKKIKIPKEKFFIYMREVGNTVSSTIPIAFKEGIKQGKIKKGSKVLCAGFGVGLSWAATIVEY